jgi:hypothetical protein
LNQSTAFLALVQAVTTPFAKPNVSIVLSSDTSLAVQIHCIGWAFSENMTSDIKHIAKGDEVNST